VKAFVLLVALSVLIFVFAVCYSCYQVALLEESMSSLLKQYGAERNPLVESTIAFVNTFIWFVFLLLFLALVVCLVILFLEARISSR
jgi:hypothetical protein